MSTYLGTLDSTDLVIVGTNHNNVADAKLNTSAIGGTDYTKVDSKHLPIEYIAIGVGGTSAGQAYETYYTSQSTLQYYTAFKGIFQEDLNGYYNYNPADAREYSVTPNDSRFPGQTSISISVRPEAQQNGIVTNLLLSPANTGSGGYWLVVFDRVQMDPPASCIPDTSYSIPNTTVYRSCGTFFQTAAANNNDQVTAYTDLSNALSTMPADHIAFLTTNGSPAVGSPTQVAQLNDGNGNFPYWGSNGLFQTLLGLGGAPYATMYLSGNTPQGTPNVYTLVSSPGFVNSLTGQAVLSTTEFAQQGQTGYVHGVLTRDLHGFYRPGHTSQGSQGTDGSDFTIAKVGAQQPIDWPELVTLLDGASSVNGQIGAYHFLSYYLLTQYYVPDTTGNYVDDIHFYFTGSNNTYLDYHTFDPLRAGYPSLTPPADAPYPNPKVACSQVDSQGNCTWNDPISGQQYVFSAADYGAVKYQMHLEITNLVNVLQYMVNGSVNMKDIIAAGNANTALALIGAASSIEAGTLQPAPSTPVKVNAGNILEMVGDVVNIAATIGTGGLVPPDLVQTVSSGITIIGDLFSASGSIAGGLASKGTASIPNPDYSFQTTIGELANSDLQGQFSAAFDATLDNILGDWGKLSQIGPMITDTSNIGFYSPNQMEQNVAVDQISQGTQRSLMLSLLPTKYQIHFWYLTSAYQASNGFWYPDLGSIHEKVGGGSECDTFYNYSGPIPYSYAVFPGANDAVTSPWVQSPGPYDGYVFTTAFMHKGQTPSGSSSGASSSIPQNLVQFIFGNGSTDLNFPMELIVGQNGPMYYPLYPSSNPSFINAAATQPSGFQNSQICSYYEVNGAPSSSNVSITSAPTFVSTTTTLTAPATAVLGENATLKASVASASGPVPGGSVDFREGDTSLGVATLDATGTATLAASGLSLGTHDLAAYYITNGNKDASTSATRTVTVYANAPAMSLSLSANSMTVSYGGTSSPVILQVSSMWGLAGSVTFSCTGLPVGMACNFQPNQASINAGGSITTSLTISAQATTIAGIPWLKGAGIILILPLSLLWLRAQRAGIRTQVLLSSLLLSTVFIGCLIGCSGGVTKSQTLQETGTKTVLVNATSGSVTYSSPMILTIQ